MSKVKHLMKCILLIIILIFFGLFFGYKILSFYIGNRMSNNLHKTRATLYGDVPKEKKGLVGFGQQISHDIVFGTSENQNTVQDYLTAGYDPNYCLKFSEGWQYRNPLMLLNSNSMYDSYYDGEKLITPDIVVFNQLIKAGADINKYPYVWASVYCHDNWNINDAKKEFENGEIDESEMNNKIMYYVRDSNRVLKMFLNAGAEVNRTGHPLPFDKQYSVTITEDEIHQYFNSPEATTPLYEAIKKGILWESQVDLLLEYGAVLDETCLEAARLSGDEAMVEKINKLWESKNK